MASKIAMFCEKHGLSIDQQNELNGIFLDILIDRCMVKTSNIKIEDDHPKPMEVDQPKPISNGKAKETSNKKFSTVKTEEYATENGLCLDDFDIDGKITKNDVIQLVKKRSKNVGESSTAKKPKVSGEKQQCHALTKNGDNCKTRAKAEKPEGANFHYCPKHYDNWKVFEENSDTEVEEEPEEQESKVCIEARMEILQTADEFENEESEVDKTTEHDDDDEGEEVTEEDLFN